jgi:hypothetical protein
MRSLWRVLALQWLGGEGSEALTGDSTASNCCSANLRERGGPSMCGVNPAFPTRR